MTSEPMTPDQWRQVYNRINANWPAQQLPTATLALWYEKLQAFSHDDVLLAVDYLIRTSKWAPSGVAEILDAIDDHDREVSAARRAHESAAKQLVARRRGGHSAPPEFRAALELHRQASRPDASAEDRQQAAAMIDALADQLDTRAAGRPETAADATRTCPGCADSPMAGRVVAQPDADARGVAVATMTPCPDCQPGRWAAWKAGMLHAKPVKAKEVRA